MYLRESLEAMVIDYKFLLLYPTRSIPQGKQYVSEGTADECSNTPPAHNANSNVICLCYVVL